MPASVFAVVALAQVAAQTQSASTAQLEIGLTRILAAERLEQVFGADCRTIQAPTGRRAAAAAGR